MYREAIRGFRQHIFPFMRAHETMESLDQLVNDPSKSYQDLAQQFYPGGLVFRKMIIAKMAGNSPYEEICNGSREMIESWRTKDAVFADQHMRVYEKIYGRLASL